MSNQVATITDIVKPELPTLTALLSLRNVSNAETVALQELNFLEQHAANNSDIVTCERISIILAVKSVMNKNLTLDPSAGLVYVKTRNKNFGTDQNQIWKKVLEIQETADGLISYFRQLGRIIDITRPKVIKDENGKVISVSVDLLKPSYPTPRWETYEFDESDFLRWRTYSHNEKKRGFKPNKGMTPIDDVNLNYANRLYTSWKAGIDPEFARAKAIRHSLKKLGANANELILKSIDYKAPLIDPKINVVEAQDNDIDYTYHEEIDSQLKQNINNEPTEKFNAEDL